MTSPNHNRVTKWVANDLAVATNNLRENWYKGNPAAIKNWIAVSRKILNAAERQLQQDLYDNLKPTEDKS